MRVLILTLQYPPDINSVGRLMARLARGLSARGHHVSVITSFPHYAAFRVEAPYRGRLHERAREDGVDVTRLWVWASGRKERMTHRLGSYLSYNALAAVSAALRRERWDVVLAPNASFFTGMTAWALRLLRGVPFIYNVQDIYPDVPVRAGQLTSPAAIRGLERFERFMYRAAAHVTVIAPSHRENLVSKGVPAAHVSVVPNFVDTDVIRPLPRDNPFARRHDLVESFVVSHAGNLGFAYDLDTLLEAARLLEGEPGVRFVLVGEGVRKAELQERAAALGLSNVRFMPYQPEADLPWLRASADVHLSLYRGHSAEFSLPSKLYEIMASGRPVLASAAAGSDVQSLVEETGAGLCVAPGDPVALANAVRQLRVSANERAAMGERGRAHAERRFSAITAVDAYETLLKRHARRA